MDRIFKRWKPRKCPKCGFSPVATILYGEPAFSKELKIEMEKGLVTLGGCCIWDGDPKWECSRCGVKIYKEEKTVE